eukprot:TRINITY_DN1720_c0_g2_i4.p1 TRINITY_DN1720_c0_g2~~TRINITY_DN1720_c0_g2_i4.p1  ORF type:complete len:374 (-),score=57.29 TRINITY_DN1720_c0_g2_i4:181-1302(-)
MSVVQWLPSAPLSFQSKGVAIMSPKIASSHNIISRRRYLFNTFECRPQLFAVQASNYFSRKRSFKSVSHNQLSGSSVETVMPNVSVAEDTSNKKVKVWRDFARHSTGEWDGYAAEFFSTGEPIELPESVVPEAFREWDVRVYDWQTQCSSLADNNTLSLRYKSVRLHPTVGCEADAATQYSVDQRQIGGTHNGALSFAFHSRGCYLAVWPVKGEQNRNNVSMYPQRNCMQHSALEVEHCIVHGQNSEARVRIIQQISLQGNGEDQELELQLKRLTVHSEQWYGPFMDGEQLGGCAVNGSGFASTAPLDISQVADLKHAIVLPKNLWCQYKYITKNQFCTEVGWLWDPNNVTTMTCEVSMGGKLKKAILQCAHR